MLDRLSPEESAEVLRRLLAGRPAFAQEARRIAVSLVEAVSFETVAGNVVDALSGVSEEDAYEKAGNRGGRYTYPGEAAYHLLEERLEPFYREMERQTELGNEPQSLEVCKGIIWGIYRFENGEASSVLELVADFPGEEAGEAMRIWRCGREWVNGKPGRPRQRREGLPREFVRKFTPDWGWLAERPTRG